MFGLDLTVFLQFLKYGICGVISMVIYQAVFIGLGYTLFPHFSQISETLGLSINQRTLNFAYSSVAGFVISDVICFFLNRKYVFEPGKRSLMMAFLLFTVFAGIGFALGLAMALAAFRSGSTGSWGANAVLIVVSVAVNFVLRKFVVFKQAI